MELDIKDGPALVKFLTDLKASNEARALENSEAKTSIGTLIDELKTVKEAVEPLKSKIISLGQGKVAALPVTQKQWAKLGMKAFAEAPIKLRATGDIEHPFTFDDEKELAEFQDSISLMFFECALKGQKPTKSALRNTVMYRERFVPAREKIYGFVKEAFNISNSGEGLEWIPNTMANEMQERIRLGWKVVGLFPMVNMPRSPYTYPVFRDDVTAYYVATPTSDSASSVTEGLGTANVTDSFQFVGKRLMVRLKWSWDFEEDEIGAAASDMRDAASAGMSNAWEKAVLDGDSDGSHMDSDVGASTTDARVMFDGLRKIALAGGAVKDCGNSALDSASQWNVLVNRGIFTPMRRYGLDRSKVAVITGTAVANQVRAIERFATAEVFSNALNKLANINDGSFQPDGISAFVASEFVREDLNSAGVYELGAAQTYALVVNRKAWKVGRMSTVGFKVLDQPTASSAQTQLIFSERGDFKQVYDFDTIHTGIGINLSTT